MSTQSNAPRIILVGGSDVGKTTMIKKMMGSDEANYPPSTGVSSYEIDKEIDGATYCFSINDTAGQEKYDSICRYFYHNAKGIIYVTTSDNEETDATNDNRLESLINSVHDAIEGYVSAIAINKSDKRQEDTEYLNRRFEDVRKRFGAETESIYHTSAINGNGLEEIFYFVFKEIVSSSSEHLVHDSPAPIPEPSKACDC